MCKEKNTNSPRSFRFLICYFARRGFLFYSSSTVFLFPYFLHPDMGTYLILFNNGDHIFKFKMVIFYLC